MESALVVGPPEARDALVGTRESEAAVRRMLALGPQVTEALQAAEREEEASPARRREDWLRRGAVLALLALTAYLYFTRPPEEPPRAPIPMRGPSR